MFGFSRFPGRLAALSSWVCVVGLCGACVSENGDWDPPGHDSIADSTSAETGEATTAAEAGSAEGDGDPATGDGDGDPTTGDGDGDPTAGDGDGDPTAGDGDGDGGPLSCGESTPASGSCPDECTECTDGVCVRFCGPHDCEDIEIVGPSNWPFLVICDDHHACKKATIECTGTGTCEVECNGKEACEQAALTCAGGPCVATCAEGFDKPCKEFDVQCGTNDTTLICEEDSNATIEQGDDSCACSSTCDDGGDDGDDGDDDGDDD